MQFTPVVPISSTWVGLIGFGLVERTDLAENGRATAVMVHQLAMYGETFAELR